MSIEVRNINKHFGQTVALRDVSFKVGSGELVALLGPSGSGKSTLLRIIAGLEQADHNPHGPAAVLFNDIAVGDRHIRQRDIGFVFQHYSLFRHMTVRENIAFGLRVKPKKQRPSKEHINTKVEELLQLIQLQTLAYRYPHQLSGGQRQRVALARALAIEPQILLLDEPFGALDAKVRAELRAWLRELHDAIHITSLFVTHDQEEAMDVADRVVVMNAGGIEQIGTPEAVYHQPISPFVMNFIGKANRFGPEDNPVYVRPHDLRIAEADEEGLSALVKRVRTAGSFVSIEVEPDIKMNGNMGRVLIEMSHERFHQKKITVDKYIKITLGTNSISNSI